MCAMKVRLVQSIVVLICYLISMNSYGGILNLTLSFMNIHGAQWLSGRVLDWRPRDPGFEPQPRHCIVSLSKNINPS